MTPANFTPQEPMAVLAVLRAARALITDPTCWTTQSGARDAEGHPVPAKDPTARSYCLAGACSKGTGLKYGEHQKSLFNAALGYMKQDPVFQQRPRQGIVGFNDNRATKHEDVLALLDRTIARLEIQTA